MELRKDGKSFAEIGKKFGISRQRVHQIYKGGKIESIKLAIKIIKSGFFDEKQVTQICRWLGFSDTAFREKKSEDKLKDYLLSLNEI